MIQGAVNRKYEIVLPLKLRGKAKVIAVEAIVDTGYNSYLTLPSALIEQLELETESSSIAILADGSPYHFEIYSAELEWDGVWKRFLFPPSVRKRSLACGY
jgi:predicted aspartyl protease